MHLSMIPYNTALNTLNTFYSRCNLQLAGAAGFHSLLQINVPQRHSVPFSFSPVGPIGRAQTKNDLPVKAYIRHQESRKFKLKTRSLVTYRG